MSIKPSCIAITGGAGFIGSNLVRWVLQHHPDVKVINFDALTYAGNVENLQDLARAHGAGGDGRYFFVRGDINDLDLVTALLEGRGRETAEPGQPARTVPRPDAIIHLAAESHVDRSILAPANFVRTNVNGTMTLLQASHAACGERPFRFVHVSTDEVYGTLRADDPPFTENTPPAPNSPYAASKAGSDFLVRAFTETYGFPAIITRCSNNYGPYQFPEKLIPLMITRALQHQPLPVYGDGCNVRDWLYVEDHAAALWAVLTAGRVGEVYNIGGGCELPNNDVVRRILALLGRPESLIRYVPDRPGHDRRYAMNIAKIQAELGWRPSVTFTSGLERTVQWYLDNTQWWRRVLSEAYRMSNRYLASVTGPADTTTARVRHSRTL